MEGFDKKKSTLVEVVLVKSQKICDTNLFITIYKNITSDLCTITNLERMINNAHDELRLLELQKESTKKKLTIKGTPYFEN